MTKLPLFDFTHTCISVSIWCLKILGWREGVVTNRLYYNYNKVWRSESDSIHLLLLKQWMSIWTHYYIILLVGLMCLNIKWKLYTYRNSNREQLRKARIEPITVRCRRTALTTKLQTYIWWIFLNCSPVRWNFDMYIVSTWYYRVRHLNPPENFPHQAKCHKTIYC